MKNISKFIGILAEFFELIFIGSAVALIVFIFIAQLSRVEGDSMLPTLETDERLIVEKLTYKFRDIQRGDIVVAISPSSANELIIKRVIGLPNETIMISKGVVYINGVALDETYIKDPGSTHERAFLKEGKDLQIPKDKYILMGDNRNKSTDSREWGYMAKDKIVGRTFMIYWPMGKLRII